MWSFMLYVLNHMIERSYIFTLSCFKNLAEVAGETTFWRQTGGRQDFTQAQNDLPWTELKTQT